ncbi:MAG: hypothetical protein AMK75_04395 [Planctomycetes bacterium SM23_65]|nr:MAG: hypothetical protein AMK75_04395 [Planctomycetes bacterium SM23_65]
MAPFRKKILVDGWEPVGLSGGGGMFTPAYSPIVPGLVMLSCDMGAEYLSRDGGRTWRMIPFRKLRANIRCTPAFHPTDPDVIFFGASDGTIMVSRDQGENWQSLSKIAGRCRGAVVFDYDNPELMLVGDVDGAWISRDGGKSWTKCTGPKGPAVGFHVDRTSPVKARRLFAATRQGVWRSDDGGVTWAEKSAGLPSAGMRSFAGASNRKDDVVMLYCVLPTAKRDGKLAGGVYRSSDAGEHWVTAMTEGINRDTKSWGDYAQGKVAQYSFVCAADPKPRTVYVMMNRNTGFYPPHHTTVFRSDDAGDHWRATLYMDPRFKDYNVEPNWWGVRYGTMFQEEAYGGAVNPGNPDQVFRSMMIVGCVATENGGKTWFCPNTVLSPMSKRPPEPDSTWLCNGLVVTSTWRYYIDPFEHNRHYICYTDIGFARSLDGGVSWRQWNPDPGIPWQSNTYALAFDPTIRGKIWGAFSKVHDIPNDNVVSGRHRATGGGGMGVSVDFGAHWKALKGGLPDAPVCSIALDPKTTAGARTLYAAVYREGVCKTTDDFRVLLHSDGTLFALVTAKRQPGRTYGPFLTEGVGLYRSKDAGEHWEQINKSRPLYWVRDFAVDPANSDIIFLGAAKAGKTESGLYRTADAGVRWQRVAAPKGDVFGAHYHPARPGWIYMTLTGGNPDFPLWLSTDHGKTWTPFREFPFGNAQRVTVDPDNPDIIYVATFGGGIWKGPAAPQPGADE